MGRAFFLSFLIRQRLYTLPYYFLPPVSAGIIVYVGRVCLFFMGI
nr:MAG TPA: hypothetical protein [Caudoviricetes sp.]